MKPYYEDSACTIYHGDCREILPTLPKARMLLTSPPYGVSSNGMIDGAGRSCADKYRGGEDNLSGDLLDALSGANAEIRFINVQMLSANRTTILLWLARNVEKFKDSLVWAKVNPPPAMEPGVLNSSHEFVFAFGEDSKRKFSGCEWRGNISSVFWCPVNTNKFADVHGAMFPESFASFFISTFSQPSDLVIDGCNGLGTTLRVAKDLGRKAIGIEIEERYCEIAAKRLAQEVFAL